MVWLYKDPEGENIFSSSSATQLGNLQRTKSVAVDNILTDRNTSDKEKIDLLAKRLRVVDSQQVTFVCFIIRLIINR